MLLRLGMNPEKPTPAGTPGEGSPVTGRDERDRFSTRHYQRRVRDEQAPHGVRTSIDELVAKGRTVIDRVEQRVRPVIDRAVDKVRARFQSPK
jgi:hypothetical protein